MNENRLKLEGIVGLLFSALLPLSAVAVPGSAATPPPMPAWQRLYVGDHANRGNIYEIAPDGSSRVYAQISANAHGLAFAPDGTLYCAGGDAVWKITPTADRSAATKENGHVLRFVEGLKNAHALARDRDGNLWLTEYFLERLPVEKGKKEQFVPGRLTKISPAGEKTIVESDLVWPYGLALGPDGDMYLASLGKMSVFRYPAAGGEKVLVADKIYWCRNVAFAPNGDLFAFGGHGITRITSDGQRSMFHIFEKGKNKHPVGLAFDANGTLYTSDVRMNKDDKEDTGTIFVYAEDGSRSVFAKVGYSPFYMAFWPTKQPDTHTNKESK